MFAVGVLLQTPIEELTTLPQTPYSWIRAASRQGGIEGGKRNAGLAKEGKR